MDTLETYDIGDRFVLRINGAEFKVEANGIDFRGFCTHAGRLAVELGFCGPALAGVSSPSKGTNMTEDQSGSSHDEGEEAAVAAEAVTDEEGEEAAVDASQGTPPQVGAVTPPLMHGIVVSGITMQQDTDDAEEAALVAEADTEEVGGEAAAAASNGAEAALVAAAETEEEGEEAAVYAEAGLEAAVAKRCWKLAPVPPFLPHMMAATEKSAALEVATASSGIKGNKDVEPFLPQKMAAIRQTTEDKIQLWELPRPPEQQVENEEGLQQLNRESQVVPVKLAHKDREIRPGGPGFMGQADIKEKHVFKSADELNEEGLQQLNRESQVVPVKSLMRKHPVASTDDEPEDEDSAGSDRGAAPGSSGFVAQQNNAMMMYGDVKVTSKNETEPALQWRQWNRKWQWQCRTCESCWIWHDKCKCPICGGSCDEAELRASKPPD